MMRQFTGKDKVRLNMLVHTNNDDAGRLSSASLHHWDH